jgi:hypothetical protein
VRKEEGRITKRVGSEEGRRADHEEGREKGEEGRGVEQGEG